MDNKRKAVFKGHVLNKLFPPVEIEKNVDTETIATTSQKEASRSQESTNKDADTKDKVYGVYLPQHIHQKLREANSAVTTSDEDSADDGDEPLPKKKRKKRGKRRSHPQPNKEDQNDNFELNDNSCQADGEETQSYTKELSTGRMKSLTKNQRRKLRKKRRRKGNVTSSEFTFEPDGWTDCQDTAAEERKAQMKEQICTELKDFLQAIWDIYSKDGKVNHEERINVTFQTLVAFFDHMDIETLNLFLHWKTLLNLRDVDKTKKTMKELKKKLRDDHASLIGDLSNYWLAEVLQLSLASTR